jgi:hypothetical protein
MTLTIGIGHLPIALRIGEAHHLGLSQNGACAVDRSARPFCVEVQYGELSPGDRSRHQSAIVQARTLRMSPDWVAIVAKQNRLQICFQR